LHTLLDLRGPIPSFIAITDGRCHDINALDVLIVEPGAFYIMDRGYWTSLALTHSIKLAPTLSSVPAKICASYATRARLSQTNYAWCVSTTAYRIVASVS
jgi:hypothetical protein